MTRSSSALLRDHSYNLLVNSTCTRTIYTCLLDPRLLLRSSTGPSLLQFSLSLLFARSCTCIVRVRTIRTSIATTCSQLSRSHSTCTLISSLDSPRTSRMSLGILFFRTRRYVLSSTQNCPNIGLMSIVP